MMPDNEILRCAQDDRSSVDSVSKQALSGINHRNLVCTVVTTPLSEILRSAQDDTITEVLYFKHDLRREGTPSARRLRVRRRLPSAAVYGRATQSRVESDRVERWSGTFVRA
jgi:hypothetical protein